MRANEFIVEGGPKRSKMHKDHEKATGTGGSIIARDTGGYDRVYHQNRLGMAMAMSDGKSTKAVKMDVAGPTEKYNSYHPYTDEEHNMIQSAWGGPKNGRLRLKLSGHARVRARHAQR